VLCSIRTGEGIEELRALLRGRLAVLVGHSGVGKSSLLNALAPEIDARTGEIGKVGRGRNKGRHTTTRSSLHVTRDGLRLIDTPGIRELGLLDLDAEGLRWYFPDLQALAAGCRFTNCRHDQEPGCAVREAAENDDSLGARYHTYRRLLADLENEKSAR
jgi:ribosome biogenesis GTPase